MKVIFLSALALIAAAAATDCDLKAIHETLSANSTTKEDLNTYEPQCKDKSGYDIFDLSKGFPTSAQAKKAQASSACSKLVNIVNSQANIDTQCSVTFNGTTVTYGHLISNFLDGRTYNQSAKVTKPEEESDSGSSESASASGSGSSDAPTTALSFVAYGAIAAIAVALR
ncbi:hypothetical protein DVH05_003147 [Phytophthora capsici]|nr:hypothetical protein DVH05_003147 [Phytophthora capsici]